MDLERIKSGRPKPVFVRALEFVLLGTLSVAILVFLGSSFMPLLSEILALLEFLVMIEVGLLAGFYGAEGLKYGFIWITYPSLSGPRRAGFRGIGGVLVSLVYVLMGLGCIVAAIAFAYLSGEPPA
ncbi:MAG: hypothetical protein ABIF01_02430 [Candidatus Micrarchaeota archaeon]